MKSCRENHLEVAWDEKESFWCPVCLLKQSQDDLRGEKEKYKNQFQKIKNKYEPPIVLGGEEIKGLFFYDWNLNGISTKEKPIDYSRKGSILS